jgi:predicted site-specific integrase-resolvase
MEELAIKLEAKYGLVMTRKEVMEAMKVSNSTVKRFEDRGWIVRVPNQGKIIRFSCENVAKLMIGEGCEC